MQQIEPLDYGKFYHIYNRGTNSCDLFFEHYNYEHFLKLYDIYISPIADTYAWVLMKNHFHLLVRIKDKYEIDYLSAPAPSVAPNPEGGYRNIRSETNLSTILYPQRHKYIPSHQFSHLFNAYAQAYNKRIGRTGSL